MHVAATGAETVRTNQCPSELGPSYEHPSPPLPRAPTLACLCANLPHAHQTILGLRNIELKAAEKCKIITGPVHQTKSWKDSVFQVAFETLSAHSPGNWRIHCDRSFLTISHTRIFWHKEALLRHVKVKWLKDLWQRSACFNDRILRWAKKSLSTLKKLTQYHETLNKLPINWTSKAKLQVQLNLHEQPRLLKPRALIAAQTNTQSYEAEETTSTGMKEVKRFITDTELGRDNFKIFMKSLESNISKNKIRNE